MGKSRIVFLDIDGTINSNAFYHKPHRGVPLDVEKVKLLNQLTGAMVVISSSWGENGGKTTEQFKEAGLELPIIGYTQHIHFQYEWACRGNEIEKWLLDAYGGMATMYGGEFQNTDYEYVIFDDDQDMLLGQIDNFIHINADTAITQEDIDKAKKILDIK